jgi:hypothetical protein
MRQWHDLELTSEANARLMPYMWLVTAASNKIQPKSTTARAEFLDRPKPQSGGGPRAKLQTGKGTNQ